MQVQIKFISWDQWMKNYSGGTYFSSQLSKHGDKLPGKLWMGLLVTGCLYTWQGYVKTRKEKEQQCRAAHKKAQTLHLTDLDSNSSSSRLCSWCLKLVTKAPLQPVSCIATVYKVGRLKSFCFFNKYLQAQTVLSPESQTRHNVCPQRG